MCGHNMVLSFLVQDPHLAKADLPHIEESASDVIHCHPKGFFWPPDPSDCLKLSQAPVVAFFKVAFVAMAHVVSAWILSLAGRSRCV